MSDHEHIKTNWYEDFFHGVANDIWRKCVSPEQTRVEADFLGETLGSKSRLLDVPCGNGRLTLELARRGCRMTGVDLSAEFIQEAKASAAVASLETEFVRGDMKQLNRESEFDGAFCFGNSFGYLTYDDMTAFVGGVARALKAGGRFVIDTGAAAESILVTLKEREWYQIEDIIFAIENRYLADVSCLETKGTFVQDGRIENRTWWHWVYTVGEIRRMLEGAGLAVTNLYNSLDQRPFKLGDPRLIVVAEKSK